MDVGRPSYGACQAVYGWMMRCTVVRMDRPPAVEVDGSGEGAATGGKGDISADNIINTKGEDKNAGGGEKARVEFEDIPLTSLHEAARDLDTQHLLAPFNPEEGGRSTNIDVRAGPKLMTPLHYAAASASSGQTPTAAAECISILLLHHHADPSILDLHNRPPYYLSTNDAVRTAFRTARATLGEDMPYSWDDDGARVGPPLTEADLARRKEQAAEKKRRQRKGRKDRKKGVKEKEEKEQEREMEEEAKKAKEEEQRRMRAGLKGKKEGGMKMGVECDFCGKKCVGKKRAQMFSRLEFVYCANECVQRHKRELMAAAATARFSVGGGSV